MNEPITIECPHCRHRWPILYATLQAQRVVYRGEHAPNEEYTIACPRCGESAVHRFNAKAESPNHE